MNEPDIRVIEALPLSAIVEWRAYLNAWPSGEEAMDLRFEVLLRETINAARWSHYIARRMAGDKTAQIPESVELADVKIFNRLGQQKVIKRGKYYDEMTPEQVARRMRSFDIDMKAMKKSKGQK